VSDQPKFPKCWVYILRCRDGSLYVGMAADVETRVAWHNAGRGASWTAKRLPVILVYAEFLDSEIAAVNRERQLKGWSRSKKEALIAGDLIALKKLSMRRVR
jgi:putative endonuclease